MAAAISVSYIPQSVLGEETVVQTSQQEASESETGSPVQLLSEGETESAAQLPTESETESSAQLPSESPAETSAQEESTLESVPQSTQESSVQESTPETVTEESTEEETTEEQTTEEETTEEETTPEETTTEEPEWSEEAPAEDTKGLTFSYSEDGQTMSVTGFDGSRSVVEIPQTYGGVKVTSIASGAFRDQTMITDVIIPEGVTYIGREAFAGCSSLVHVQIPSSVTQVGANLFEGTPYDSTLTGDLVYINSILYRCQTDAPVVSIQPGTTVIAEEAFLNRINLMAVTIPDGVSYIGSNAFKNCSALSEIEVPGSVRDIVANAFDGTKWYEQRKNEMIYVNDLLYRAPSEIEVQIPSPTGSLSASDAEAASQNGVQTQLIPLTDAVVQEGTTTICTLAFANTPVQSVQLPSTLTSIRYGAFQNCTALRSIQIPSGVTFIESGSFQNCTALTGITVPETVTYLGAAAFSGCSSLQTAVLPNSLTRVNSGMFENCTALSAVSLSQSLASMGSRAFANTTALKSIDFAQTLQSIAAECFSGSGISSAVLGTNVTYLGAGAFEDCTSLTAVELASAIRAIRERTFRNCTELRSITIHEGIRYIGTAAFQNAVSLQTIVFPQSLLTICDNAFEGSGVGEGLVLPSAIRTIGNRAFAGCIHVTSLTIPADVRRMGSQVFADASNPSLVCSFSRTAYMEKLSSGWMADWGSGVGSLAFTGGTLSEEQKADFLLTICKVVPDFNASAADGTFYSAVIGRIGVSAKAGDTGLGVLTQAADEGWICLPEFSVRKAILNRTGLWMQDYYPQNTGVEDVYYADGYYYVREAAFENCLTKGYLSTGQNESGWYFFKQYDAQTGIVEGSVTLQLTASDNDTGIEVVSRLSEGIGDAYYENVYESAEERELCKSIEGIWTAESLAYRYDSYTRIVTVQTPESESAYRYSCKPGETETIFSMKLEALDEGTAVQTRNFDVQYSPEERTMQLIDTETGEVTALQSNP